MHSAIISSRLRYRAMPLAGQLVHKGSVHPGPLVLGTTPFKSPAPTPDRDRTVSRRSKPSSRTAFIGEQPNPWDLLQPQDAMSRHRTESTVSCGVDYIIISPRAVALRCLASICNDESRRVAPDSALGLMSEASPFGSVVTGSIFAVEDDFPRYRRAEPLRAERQSHSSADGFTVISRFVGARSPLQHPDVLRCQTS